MASKKYWIGGIVLVVLGVAAFLSSNYTQDAKQGASSQPQQSGTLAEAGHLAPGFSMPSLEQEGKTVKLSDLKGKPVFLNFWASWCGPCKGEMPDLENVYNKYKDQVTFYAVNLTSQDDVTKAKAFLKQYNITIPVLEDTNADAMKAYSVISIPTTFMIDKNGMVLEKRQGALSQPAMEGIVERALKQK